MSIVISQHSSASRERNCQLDLLRATAIIMVVVYHLIQQSPVPLLGIVRFAHFGQYGVDLFFVLSGWLIGSLYWKEKARFGKVELFRFWARRWMRTIPPYLAALLIAWLAVSVTRHESFNWGYLIFIQNYYERLPYFLVSWSLCIEEHFYLFLPLFLLWGGAKSRRSISILFLTLILIAPICRCLVSWNAIVPATFGFKLTATHLRYEGLLLGFWAAYVPFMAPSGWFLLRRWSLYVALSSGMILTVALLLPDLWTYRMGLSVLAIGFVSVLIALVARKPIWPATSRPIHLIAISSYSIYLTHPLMLHIARRIISASPNFYWFLYFPIALGLVGAAGTLFYLAVERTSIQLRDRWVARRKGISTSIPDSGTVTLAA